MRDVLRDICTGKRNLSEREFNFFNERAKFGIELSIERKQNKKLFSNKKLEFISLGENCFPRVLLTRWGLKKTKEEGALSYPFDLAIHRLPITINLLRCFFEGYTNKENIIFDNENTKWFKDGFWTNTKYKNVWNHDLDIEIVDGLIKRYNKRIQNFENILNSKTKKIFILYLETTKNIKLIKKLFNVLHNSTNNFEIICLIKGKYEFKAKNKKIHTIRVDIPKSGYNIFKMNNILTPIGLNFERRLINRIINMIDNMEGIEEK